MRASCATKGVGRGKTRGRKNRPVRQHQRYPHHPGGPRPHSAPHPQRESRPQRSLRHHLPIPHAVICVHVRPVRKGRVPRRQAQRRPHFEFSRSRLWLPDSARARQRRSAHARAHPLVHVSAVVSGLHGMLVHTDPGALASGPPTRPGTRSRCVGAVGHGRSLERLARHQPNHRVFAVLRARVLPKTAGHSAHSQLARGIVRSCDRSRDCRHTRDRPRCARVVLSHGLWRQPL